VLTHQGGIAGGLDGGGTRLLDRRGQDVAGDVGCGIGPGRD
jgi:hypothetical protein